MNALNTFTAIDFEAAQGMRHSICQVGLVRVEDCIVTKKLSILVKPPDNFYSFYNSQVHGITAGMTRDSPTFDKVWHLIEPFICDQNIVAHNSSFDINCLQQTLAYYRMNTPAFKSHCTYKIYGQKLNYLCRSYGIELNHHDALSDAMACAQLFLLYNKQRTFSSRSGAA